MAISTPTSALNENITADGNSFVTVGNWTPVPGRLYYCVVKVNRSSNPVSDGTLTHAGGETWVKSTACNQVSNSGGITNGGRVVLWSCLAVGSTAGTLTYDCGAVPHNCCSFLVIEIASGFNAAAPTPQGAGATANGGLAVTPTLGGAFVDANSITLTAAGHFGGVSGFTVPTGFTQLQTRAETAPSGQMTTAYLLGNDTTADWTTVTTDSISGIIWEVAAQTGGGLFGDDPGWSVPLPSLNPTVSFW